MTINNGISPKNPSRYLGPNVYLSSIVSRNRAPTSADYKQPETGKLYPLGSYWIVSVNPTTGTQGDLWYLSKIAANVAYWLLVSSGSSGPLIKIGVPDGTTPVYPDATGLINFTSTDGSVVITGSAGGLGAQNINFSTVEGSFTYVSISFADSPYTALSTDDYISCDTSGGAITIRLPNAPTTLKRYYIKDRTGNASVNNISVTTVGGVVTIDGLTTYLIAGNRGSITVLFNGSSYEIF